MAASPPRTSGLRPRPQADQPDGGFWLIDLLIWVLAGSITGIIVWTADFTSPWILAQQGWSALASSGWAQLGYVASLIVLLELAARWLRRAVRRRVQVCVLLSLLVHCWLAALLCAHRLSALPAWVTGLAQLVLDRPGLITAPDYHWQYVDEPSAVQDFERPVPTGPPAFPDGPGTELQPARYEPPVAPPTPPGPEPIPDHRPEAVVVRPAQQPTLPEEYALPDRVLRRQELDQRLGPPGPMPEPRAASRPEIVHQPAARVLPPDRQPVEFPGEPPRGAGAEPVVGPARPPVALAFRDFRTQPELEPPVRQRLERSSARLSEVGPSTPEPTGGNAGATELAEGRLEARAEAPGRRIEAPTLGPPSAQPPQPALDAGQFQPVLPSGVAGRIGLAAQGLTPQPSAALPRRAAWRAVLPKHAAGPQLGQPPPLADQSQPGPLAPEPAGGSPQRAAMAPIGVQAGRSDMPAELMPGGQPSLFGPSIARRGSARVFSQPTDRPGPGPLRTERPRVRAGLPGLPVEAQRITVGTAQTEAGQSPGAGRHEEAGPAGLADLTGPDRGPGVAPPSIAGLPGLDPIGRGLLAPERILPARPSGSPGQMDSRVAEGIGPRPLLPRRGGPLPIESTIRGIPAPAFRQRDPAQRGKLARAFGGSQQSEQAVERGLGFLARQQFADGRWALDRLAPAAGSPEPFGLGTMNGDTAATGLALLAFLGAGYSHLDGRYEATVRRGIDWLVQNQQPDGCLSRPATDQNRFTRSYGHAIGTIVLCEAYGMTGDPILREPAERAVQFICRSQDPAAGGWRYEPQVGSDTSVSGWKLMALKSAQMAGLEVPEGVLGRVSDWLDAAQSADGSRYAYNPFAPDTDLEREGRRPNLPMTAEGLLMRIYLGWDRNNPALNAGAAYLLENLPDEGPPQNRLRDVYYWYYATQVMFQLQGAPWKAWFGRLCPLLEKSQVARGPLAGSWDPQEPVRDRWAHAGGRLYVTALSLLMLEVPYRHLPLYQTLETPAANR
ncbi:MAG: hypothetical protein ACUVUC_01770 [Thermoguttaceae bacterium]